MLTVDQALAIVQAAAQPLGQEVLPLGHALGRILAEEIRADRPLPPFDRATMDGFALRSAEWQSPEQAFEIVGTLAAGENPKHSLGPQQTLRIMTGAALPAGLDAIVEVEKAVVKGSKVSFQITKLKPFNNVAQKGEDAQAGQLFFTPGERITPSMAAFLASVGKAQVAVYRKPKVAVLSTGTEIVPVEAIPAFYQIRDSNQWSIQGMAQELGLEVTSLGIVPDEEALLKAKIQEGLNADVLLLSGGVSMGEFDLVPKIMAELGVKQIFHKVKIKPGKPIWFGQHAGGFVFGLPGNPVSVQACFKIFAEPLLLGLLGQTKAAWGSFWMPLAVEVKKKTDREQFTPVMIEGGQLKEVRIQGSGDFSNLVHSQGMLRMAAEQNELPAGTLVEFVPWRRL